MVVTFLPATCETAVWQERVALPSTWTVQAPHRPAPQPNLVPVSFMCSRTTQSNGVSGSTSTFAALPFTVSEIAAISSLPRDSHCDLRKFPHVLVPMSWCLDRGSCASAAWARIDQSKV